LKDLTSNDLHNICHCSGRCVWKWRYMSPVLEGH